MPGVDPNTVAFVDNSVVLEDLFYEALRAAVIEGSQRPAEVGNLTRDFTIAVSGGIGALPDSVINECLDNSSIYSGDDDDIGQFSSFQTRYSDFIRAVHPQIAYYHIQGTNFLFRDIGGDPNDFDGDINLITVALPDIPSVITDLITISSETAERAIVLLAEMLRGSIET